MGNSSTQPDGKTQRVFCSEFSRTAEEQLCGTAKTVDLWLLVEHRGRWERNAIDSIQGQLHHAVRELQLRIPRMRFGLIAQPGRRSAGLTVFVALSRESNPVLRRLEVGSTDELASMGLAGLIADCETSGESPRDELFLICTHGIHDPCCAKYGNRIYTAAARVAAATTWQVSHVGGCRFAPNIVCLPHGILYGRVAEDDFLKVVDSYRNREILLDGLRGRCCYSKPVQAAEYYLRSKLNLTRLDRLRLAQAESLSGAAWKIVFRDIESGALYEIEVESHAAAGTYKSCSAATVSNRERFSFSDCVPVNL